MSGLKGPCTCKAMGPGGECSPCEKWRCRKCLRVNGWYDSGTDDDDGVCDDCRHPQATTTSGGEGE